MRRLGFAACACACAAAAWGSPEFGLFGDTPDARHAWAVHDRNRPYPVQVETPPGKPPSDAVVLFDGTAESVEKNWVGRDGKPTKWTVRDGMFVCVPGSGVACTRQAFGDAQLHIEWRVPLEDARKNGQYAGNSGVFPMGLYEIQILNSYDPDPAADVKRNYPDGIAASVYGQNPPLVNAARPAGEWQSYDIVFHPPTWEGETLVDPGSVTVFLNGVLVQDHWELECGTSYKVRPVRKKHAAKLPWLLQDHGDPVPFRNIWIRELPSRTANTTAGGRFVKEADVRALRDRLAAEVFAKVDETRAAACDVKRALETLSYSLDARYVAAAKRVCAAWKARYDALSAADRAAADAELKEIRASFGVLKRCGVLDVSGFPLAR